MKMLFLIQCHKNIDQIKLLIRSLELSPHDHVIIHVDAKQPLLRNILYEYYLSYHNVSVISDPVSVYWSGISQVHATLKMIKYAYTENISFDYCSLLSGEDILLSACRLKLYLDVHYSKSFIEFRCDKNKYLWRINRFNLFRNNRYSQRLFFRVASTLCIKMQRVLKIKRNNFREDDIYIGSQWFTIFKTHMDIVYNIIDDELLKKLMFTSCCDEHLFQMLFRKYINNDEYIDQNLRFTNFSNNGNSPKYLSLNELNVINKMEDIFIARKVTYETLFQFCHKNNI